MDASVQGRYPYSARVGFYPITAHSILNRVSDSFTNANSPCKHMLHSIELLEHQGLRPTIHRDLLTSRSLHVEWNSQ